MLERLRLTDFQVHAKLDVTLDPAITTFVGASDVGKSAVLRALRWVLTNVPAGDAFVRHGTTSAKAELIVDGRTVTRVRGPSTNLYQLDGETYKSFGASAVPDTIAAFLNVGPVNFQGQLDGPFWLGESAAEVSRRLNAIVDLSVIDDVLAGCAAEVRKTKSMVELTEERLKTARAERDRTAWAAEMDDELYAVEKSEVKWQESFDEMERLHNLTVVSEGDEHRLKQLTVATVDAQYVLDQFNAARLVGAEINALQIYIREIEQDERDAADDPFEEFKETVLKARVNGDLAAAERSQLAAYLDDLEQLEDELCELDEQLTEATETLKREAGGRCPVCGGTFDPLRSSLATSTCPTDAQSPAGRETRGGIKRKKDT